MSTCDLTGILSIIILRGTMNYERNEFGTKFRLRQTPDEKPSRVDIQEIKSLLTPELYESHGKFYAVSLCVCACFFCEFHSVGELNYVLVLWLLLRR